MNRSIKLLGLMAATAMVLPMGQAAGQPLKLIEVEALENLALKQVQPNAESRPPGEGTLAEGDQVLREDGRRFDSYSFQGEAGVTLRITVTSEAFAPFVFLVDRTTGETIAQQTGDLDTVSLTVQLPNNGEYWFGIAAAEPPGEGSYQFQVVRVQAATGLQAEANRLFSQGVQQYNSGQLEEAISFWEQALQLYEELGSLDARRIVLTNLSVAWIELLNRYADANQYQQIIDAAEPALSILIELGNRAGESSILGTFGVAYKELGEYERAIELHQQALEIASEIEDKTLQARALNNLGVAYRNQGDYPRAINAYEQSLALAQETEDLGRQINALVNLGNAHKNSSSYQQAINYYEQAIELSQEIDGGHELTIYISLSQSYSELAHLRLSQGRHNQAIFYFQKSLELIYELADNEILVADNVIFNTLNGLGIAHRNIGDYQQAIVFFEMSFNIAIQIEDLESQSIALGNIGAVYANLGNPQRAVDYQNRSLLIARAQQERTREGQLLRNLAGIYATLGDYQQSRALYEQGLEIARELEDRRGIFAALLGLTRIGNALGLYTPDHHEEALEIARSLGNPVLIADILLTIGDLPYTVTPNPDGEGLSLTFNFSGEINPENIGYLEEALSLYRSNGIRDDQANVLVSLARAYLVGNRPEISEEYLLEATSILDEIRKDISEDSDRISLFQRQSNAFSLLQEALVEQDKFEAALGAAERGRGRALATLLLQQTENDAVNLESDTTPDISNIRQTARQTQSTLVAYSLIRDTDQEYWLSRWFSGYNIGQDFNYSIYMWVVSPDGSVVFRELILNGFDLEGLIANTRDAMGVGDVDRAIAIPSIDPNQSAQDLAQRRAETDENLRQLHQILIEPISDLLPTDPNQKVAFIPQGEIFLVPFPALKDADGDYLIENHTILTAPSIQVLQLTQDLSTRAQTPTPLQTDNPLIVGDPAMPTVTFLSEAGNFEAVRLQPLYGARQEAEAVGATLNASALLGDAATEARVKQQIASADLIHLATHGLLEYGDPRQTGSRDTPGAIALAPGNGEDGLLTSTEILQMELQADLVVLSACDTGRGRITGDGVIGLSRSFIAAGVPSVIVSLWAVPDAPTADLMRAFYDQLAQGETKVQALRQAMLITMQTRPDPKDWAAFTLIGNAE